MNPIVISLSEVIGLTILHSLWQVTLLWIVLVTLLRLWPRASSEVRYALAISTLLLSVIAIAGTAAYEYRLNITGEEASTPFIGTTHTPNAVDITVKATFLSKIVDTVNDCVPILTWLWCAGLVVMGTRFGGSLFYLRTLRAKENIAAVQPVWERELLRLSRALGVKCDVALATSRRISSPLTLGSISPIILLPAGLSSGLSTAQIEAILVHELYHIKRQDYFVNICQVFVEVLLFYHPAIWHINNIIREERENCCDDLTVAFCGDVIGYARTLTQVQEFNTLTKPILGMSATGPNSGNFTARIKRLFNIYPNPSQARSKGMFAIGFLVAYLCIVLAGANISSAKPVEKENEPPRSRVNDHRFNKSLSDSISARPDADASEVIEITPRQTQSDAGAKIGSMDAQRKDTTMQERSLDKCLKQVRELLTLASIYGLSGDSLRLYEFTSADSLDFVSKTTRKLQPTRFYGTLNRLRMPRSDVMYAADNEVKEEPIKPELPATLLYVVDGVRIDRSQSQIVLNQIPPESIASLAIYKGQEAMDLYGDEGKHGVVDIRLKAGTSFNEIKKDVEVQVFPDATKDRLNITFTPVRNNSRVKMVLIDSNGTAIKEITDSNYDSNPAELHVDLSDYQKGIYILQINIDGATSQQRIVVE